MITIVYGHPYDRSFNAAIRQTVIDTLRGENAAYTLIDLYADGFDPAVRAPELALYSQGRTCDALAQRYMEILGGTDRIIYVYPVWWGTEPAIVKGFHDKVLLKDFSWVYSPEGRLLPKLRIGQTTLFTTSEAPTECFSAYFADYLPAHVFAAVGMGNAAWHNFGGITQSTPEERAVFLQLVAEETLRTCRA